VPVCIAQVSADHNGSYLAQDALLTMIVNKALIGMLKLPLRHGYEDYFFERTIEGCFFNGKGDEATCLNPRLID